MLRALCATLIAVTIAQAPAPKLATSTGIPGLIASGLVFNNADANKDGVVTRDELEAVVAKWFASADTANAGSVTVDQLKSALTAALPMQSFAAMATPRGGQPQTPESNTVQAMMAALPASAQAKPAHARKVLVLAHASGFVHSSIPLAAKTIDALGTKTGAWTTTITYDAADINADNLRQYDAIFLASTTGAFLDDPKDEAATAARRQALLDFVRGGKGLAGIHASTDSYHRNAPAQPAEGRGAGGRGAGGGNPFANLAPAATLAEAMIAQGDTNTDGRLDKAESKALADAWFDAIDTRKSGRLLSSDFALFGVLIPNPPGAPVPQEPDSEVGTWPDFNTLIGGYFKFHWLDPQLITVKIDDPKSPLTAMFHGQEFDVRDEIYTMGMKSFSRANVHVLTSIDYGKMSDADKALESNPRADRDFGLSWIRREGEGRVFYEALGHSERIYANRAILAHLLAGMQYALGDLKADDAPTRRPGL